MYTLTVTPKYPANNREPMTISNDPIRNRNVARAMAL